MVGRSPALVLGLALLGAACRPSVGAAEPAPHSPIATASARAEPATPEPTPSATPPPTPSASATPEPWWEVVPVPANDPAALAEQLATVERAIRDPSLTGDRLAWMGHLEQLIVGRLADHPEWREPVLAALSEASRKAVSGSLEAGRQLRMMNGPIPKSLPRWQIVEPEPIDALLAHYRKAEAQFGVPWYYLAAIHLVETRMGRIRGLSSAGAQGPMQFMPPTWAAYGQGDVQSNHDSIMAAGRYLKAAGAPGDMARAVFAYNHDTRYVGAVTAYAQVIRGDPDAYRGYHGWQVYYPTTDGPLLLPVGWKKD